VSQSPSDDARPGRAYSLAWEAIYELMREGRSWSGYERNRCFLNTGDGHFADISSIAGVDLPHDGRGLALVDWDQDGALDLWMTSRTGPRLRFMRNQAAGTQRFVALRLEGTRGNRDGIGARVEVIVPGAGGRRFVRSIRAGEGFIGQSSKWAHFGLGTAASIEEVVVTWPGGAREIFTGAAVDGRFILRQGTGSARPWQRPVGEVRLTAAEPPARRDDGTTRVRLAAPLPLPGLTAEGPSGERVAIPGLGRPRLLSLWATWCPHCGKELEALRHAAARLQSAGIGITAVSVDVPKDRAEAASRLQSIMWPSDSCYGDDELLSVVEILQLVVLDRPQGLVLPTSLLFDANGQLIAIYRGPVDPDVILRDATTPAGSPAEMRQAAVPYPGPWVRPPDPPAVVMMANRLRDAGHLLIASEILAGVRMRRDSPAPDWAKVRLAESNTGLGIALAESGRDAEAVKAFERALSIVPDDTRARQLLGTTLARLGRTSDSIQNLRAAIASDPDDPWPHHALGQVLHETGALDEAISAYESALRRAPESSRVHFDLGRAAHAHGDRARAEAMLQFLRRQQSPLAKELAALLAG
jgi:tetratricopeptide (TPR) repeat protein